MAEADQDRHARVHPPRLNPSQLAVFATLDDLIEERGWAPTYAELLGRLGWSPNSKGTLHRYLEQLRRKGVIAGAGRSPRVLR